MPTFQFGTTSIEYNLQQVVGKEDISGRVDGGSDSDGSRPFG
jgi:hypothetical protein